MTQVKYENFELIVKGHSRDENGRAYKKNDVNLVCCACSMLTYTFVDLALLLYEEGKLKEEPVIELDDGYSHILLKPNKKERKIITMQLQVLLLGYEHLSKEYPEYITVLGGG